MGLLSRFRLLSRKSNNAMPNTPPKKNSGKRWPFSRRKKSSNAPDKNKPKNNPDPRFRGEILKNLHRKLAFAERAANRNKQQAAALRKAGLNTFAAEANANKERVYQTVAKLRAQINALRNKGTWTAHPVSLQGNTLTISPNEFEASVEHDRRFQKRSHFLHAKRANNKAKAALNNAKRTASKILGAMDKSKPAALPTIRPTWYDPQQNSNATQLKDAAHMLQLLANNIGRQARHEAYKPTSKRNMTRLQEAQKNHRIATALAREALAQANTIAHGKPIDTSVNVLGPVHSLMERATKRGPAGVLVGRAPRADQYRVHEIYNKTYDTALQGYANNKLGIPYLRRVQKSLQDALNDPTTTKRARKKIEQTLLAVYNVINQRTHWNREGYIG